MMALLTLIIWLVILGVIAYLIETYLPMAAPFKLIIRVIIVIAAIWCLLNFLGLPGLRFR